MADYKENNIDNVQFSGIKNPGLVSGGLYLGKGRYRTNTNGDISAGLPFINAIDIDWNNATITGVDGTISTTAQLLSLIGKIKEAISGTNDPTDPNAKSIIERLESIEETLENLPENQQIPESLLSDIDNIKAKVNNLPNNLTQTLSNITTNLNTTTAAQQQIGTRLVAAEASVTSLSERVNTVETNVNKFKHVIIEKEDYDNLTSYEPNTLYFIIGEPDFGGGGSNTDGRIELDSISTSLTINSVLYKNSDIILEPGLTYNISGTLRGHIIVDASTKTAAEMKEIDNTTIILNNVIINSDANYAIYYKTPQENTGYKDLVVKISKNTTSVIYCPTVLPVADNQFAAIHSDNNLLIEGVGYLSICNKGGHGIRATQLDIAGPHIYFDVSHDGIHGKYVNIDYGYFYMYHANDGIGTSESGSINVWGGSFITKTLNGDLFDSKNNGLYNQNISFDGPHTMQNMLTIDPDHFVSVAGGNNPGTIRAYVDKAAWDSDTNEMGGILINATSVNGQMKYWINDTYSSYEAYVIRGVISYPIEISFSNAKDCTLYLCGSYITDRGNLNTPTIYFNPIASAATDNKQKGRLKIISKADTINIIVNKFGEEPYGLPENYESDAIKSENNLAFEIKNDSHLFVTANNGDGIDGGDIKINESKGYLIVTDCGFRGMKGNAILIGPEAVIGSSFIDDSSYVDDPTNDKYETFDGTAIFKNNCKHVEVGPGTPNNKNVGFADVFCRNGGKYDKGVFGTRNNELNGTLVMGTIGAVRQIDMNNAVNLYYNRIVTPNVTLIGIPLSANENIFAKNLYQETLNS